MVIFQEYEIKLSDTLIGIGKGVKFTSQTKMSDNVAAKNYLNLVKSWTSLFFIRPGSKNSAIQQFPFLFFSAFIPMRAMWALQGLE